MSSTATARRNTGDPSDLALHEVVDHPLSLRHVEPDREGPAFGFVGGELFVREAPATAVVAGRLAPGERGGATFLELLGRAPAPICVAGLDQPGRRVPVGGEPFRLPVWAVGTIDVRTLVPVQAQPGDVVEHAPVGLLRDPARVGVFDAQDEGPAVVPRVEPGEQRAANVSHVEGSRGGRREPAANGHARTSFRNVPTPSTSTSTTSPADSGPTPSGVPVSSASPGSRVMNAVMYSIRVATPKAISDVEPCWRTSPFSHVRTVASLGSRSVSI